MKVALIYPGEKEEPVGFVPLGLVYLATVLQSKGHTVRIFDQRIYDKVVPRVPFFDEIGLLKVANIEDYDVYCLSVMTSQVKEAVKLSKLIKEKFPNKRIVWGGLHPTLYPDQVLKASYVDSIILGEAECIIEEAINTNARVYHGTMLPFDQLPLPDYSLLEMSKYSIQYKEYKRVIDIALSRGCPFSCSFCLNHSDFYKKYRKMSLDQAKQLIDNVVALGADCVWLRDDYLFQDMDWAMEIAQYFKKKGVAWTGNIRANDFKRMPEGYLQKLKDSGCDMILFGIESGNDEMLKKIRKGITVQMAIDAVTACAKVGLTAGGTFICGYPNETREQQMDTARLILKLYEIMPYGNFSASVLRPYPGADIFNECVALGYKVPQSNEEWAKLDSTFTVYHSAKQLSWIKDYWWFVRFFNYLQTILYFKRKGKNTNLFEDRLFKNGWDSTLVYWIKKARHLK